jgi:hypothetical protein
LGIENGYGFNEATLFQSFLKRKALRENSYSPLPLYKVLSEVTGKIQNTFYERESYRIPYDLALPSRYRQKYVRFCPLCLDEDQYHRVDWFIKPIFFCIRHKTLLEYECRYCKNSISMRDVVYATCGQCKGMLKSKNGYQIDEQISSFFQKDNCFFDRSPFYGSVPKLDYLAIFYKLLYNLMRFYGEQLGFSYSYKQIEEYSYRCFYNENNEMYKDMVRLGIKIFSNWPDSFLRILQQEGNVRGYQKAADFFDRLFYPGIPDSVITWFDVATEAQYTLTYSIMNNN